MGKKKKTAAKAKKNYTLLPKAYLCKIGKSKTVEREALRADSAALEHVQETMKAQSVGKAKVIAVNICDANGKKSVVKIRDESLRKVTIQKN